jgi:uncharacterized delta-60 repeat protein
MKSNWVECLEGRYLLSASALQNSLHAKAQGVYVDTDDPEEAFDYGIVALSWTRAATTPVDGYHIFASTDGKHYEQIAEAGAHSNIDNVDLVTGTKYFFKVRPFTRAAGDQATLGWASAVTDINAPLLGLYPESDGTIGASFFENEDTPTQFKLEWAPAGSSWKNAKSKTFAAVPEDDGRRDYVDGSLDVKGLDPNKVYEFHAYAMNSLISSEAAIQQELPLTSPDNVVARAKTDGTVKVTWTSDSTHATGYKVEWAPSEQGYGKYSLTVGKNARSATIKTLAEGVDYDVHVLPLSGKIAGEPSVQVDAQRVSVLDRSFNQFGDYAFDYPGPVKTDIHNGSQDTASDVAVQPDGKVVVVGTSHHNFEVVRYNPDGTLDTTFNQTGKVSIDFGGDDQAHAVALVGDLIYIAGTSDKSWAIAVITTYGEMESSFGDHGKMLDNQAVPSADAWNIIIDHSTVPFSFFVGGIAIPRNPDGTLGAPEAEIHHFVAGELDPQWHYSAALIPNVTGKNTAMALQSDGKALLACQTGNGITVARFNPNGTADTSFGPHGRRIIRFATGAQNVYGITTDTAHDILIAGQKGSGSASAFAIARLKPDGSPDASFGTDGKAYASFGNRAAAQARDITVLPTGQIVSVGTARGNFAVARFTSDGALDSDFDQDGMATTDIGSPGDVATALALNPDGTIYAAGTSGGDFAVVRYFVSPVNTPSDVLLDQEMHGGLFLEWTNNALDEDAIKIQRAESLDGPWVTRTTIQPPAATDDSYVDDDFVVGATYYYRVIAVRGRLQSLPAVAGPVTTVQP